MQGSCLVETWAIASSPARQMAAWNWSDRLVNTTIWYLQSCIAKYNESVLFEYGLNASTASLQVCLWQGRERWLLVAAKLWEHRCTTCCCGTTPLSPPVTLKPLIYPGRYKRLYFNHLSALCHFASNQLSTFLYKASISSSNIGTHNSMLWVYKISWNIFMIM